MAGLGDEVDLSAVSGMVVSATGKIWERAEDAAQGAREQLGIGEGPIDDEKFGERIGHKVPFEGPATEKVGNVELPGGYRPRKRIGLDERASAPIPRICGGTHS
jgi:hypothetical protein